MSENPRKMWKGIKLAMHDGVVPEEKSIKLRLGDSIVIDDA
jgi:hypothetical protein